MIPAGPGRAVWSILDGSTSPRETTPAQVSYVYSFDHEGMVRSNGYCDDNTRPGSTVHGCNTSLNHGSRSYLTRSIGTGVAVGGARPVRPRRHCVCDTWLTSHVSTTDALQRFPTHRLHQSRGSLDGEPRRRTGIEARVFSERRKGGNVTKSRLKPEKRAARTRGRALQGVRLLVN